MYSTHCCNTSLYRYVLFFFITLCTPPEEEEVKERASLLAAVYHPPKELNQNQNSQAIPTIQFAKGYRCVLSILSK